MKSFLGALFLVPVLAATAAAQEPNADAKEGRFYVEGGVGFGVMSMVPFATTNSGFDSIAEFTANFGAQYGITEQFSLFTKLGFNVGLDNDPGVLNIGMTFDGAYKVMEKKGDAPAMSVYAGLGFVHLDIDPKGPTSDAETDFVFEFGTQLDIGPGDPWSLQPYIQIQLVAGDRPEPGGATSYNGVLQVGAGMKFFYKLSDNLYLEPAIGFVGGNFQDQVVFSVGIQLRL